MNATQNLLQTKLDFFFSYLSLLADYRKLLRNSWVQIGRENQWSRCRDHSVSYFMEHSCAFSTWSSPSIWQQNAGHAQNYGVVSQTTAHSWYTIHDKRPLGNPQLNVQSLLRLATKPKAISQKNMHPEDGRTSPPNPPASSQRLKWAPVCTVTSGSVWVCWIPQPQQQSNLYSILDLWQRLPLLRTTFKTASPGTQ